MGRAPLLGAACPRTPSTEQNSILQLVLQALRPAPPARARFHPGIGIYGALHAPKPPEQGKIPSYNSLCRALRPVSDPYSRFHLGVGHYGALHTPKPPWFLSGERKEPKLAGETPAPPTSRNNWYARKIPRSPRLERGIFPLSRMPSRGYKKKMSPSLRAR